MRPPLKSIAHTKGERGAYYSRDSNLIEMGDKSIRPESSAEYARVLRHEVGHHVDYGGGDSPRSVRFIDALEADGADLNRNRTRALLGDADLGGPELDAARKSLSNYTSEARTAARKGGYRGDARRIVAENIPEVSFEGLEKIYGAISYEDAIELQAAWKARDVSGLLDLKINGDSHLVGLQDTFSASLKGRVRMLYHHDETYYIVSGAGGQTGEAFANWFDVVGSGNHAATALYKHLFPRTFKAIEEMIE